MEIYYIKYLTRRLKRYIIYYPQYQLNQIIRYILYKNLKFILTPALIFYTIIINFILIFLLLKNEFNIIINIINKFSKKIIFTLKKDI